MLKIKDNVDLKELEKFNFKQIDYVNVTVYEYKTDFFNYIIGPDKIIHYNQFTVHNELDNIIYDLIKANLVDRR